MQINLTNQDIEEAVRNHLKAAGISLPVATINFTQTRNPPGISAEIQINGSISDMLQPATTTLSRDGASNTIFAEKVNHDVPADSEEDSLETGPSPDEAPNDGKVRLFS